MDQVRALIPTGLGFNCEYESAKAFELAGAKSTVCDIRDIISGKVDLFSHDVLMFVGGFSYGDDIGSGRAVANLLRFRKIKTSEGEMRFIEAIEKFVQEQGKIVFGVCNGFQVLVKLGILPGFDGNYEEQNTTLTLNDSGRYEDRWVSVHYNPQSRCVATQGIKKMYLPVRHGEGKLIADTKVLQRIMDENHYIMQYSDSKTQPTMTYPQNPNGSYNSIAGLSDKTGRIFGMMPHPEAYLLFENHPHWTRLKRELIDSNKPIPTYGEGLRIFKNIVNHCKEEKTCYPTLVSKSN